MSVEKHIIKVSFCDVSEGSQTEKIPNSFLSKPNMRVPGFASLWLLLLALPGSVSTRLC